jgi:regulator of protease activity HflC (stomatin/prohibitin superfamily)
VGKVDALMLDKLVDFVLSILDLARFWVIVRAGDVGVIYTFGKPTRVVGSTDGWFGTGLHLKAFGWEQEDVTCVREEIWEAGNTAVTTADGKQVHLRGAFRWQILAEKAVTYQTTLGDEVRATSNAFRSAITETVVRRPLADLLDPGELRGLRAEILDRARKTLNPYGCKVHDFWWTERVVVRTYRLITGE